MFSSDDFFDSSVTLNFVLSGLKDPESICMYKTFLIQNNNLTGSCSILPADTALIHLQPGKAISSFKVETEQTIFSTDSAARANVTSLSHSLTDAPIYLKRSFGDGNVFARNLTFTFHFYRSSTGI